MVIVASIRGHFAASRRMRLMDTFRFLAILADRVLVFWGRLWAHGLVARPALKARPRLNDPRRMGSTWYVVVSLTRCGMRRSERSKR
jgi:hypothetical protein